MDNKYERFSEHAFRVPQRYTLGRGIEEEVSSDNIYSAQSRKCLEIDCDTISEHMGDVGLCEYHALVGTFRDYFKPEPYEDLAGKVADMANVDVFGTLTFAPRSVSPTNLNFRFEDTGNGHLNDPPVGIQRGVKAYEDWERSLRITFRSRLRRIIAVTEYGSNNNTGRLHIHYIMRVLCHSSIGEVPKLLWNIRNTRLSERWQHGFSMHEQVKQGEGALQYVTKYIAKDAEKDKTNFWTYDPEAMQPSLFNDNRV